MNPDWCSTSKVIAEIMIVSFFRSTTSSGRKFHISSKVAVTRLFCTTTCRQTYGTRWSLLQVKCCSKGPPFPLLPLLSFSLLPPRPLTKPEATPGDRIDLRISGQPEEPYRLNEKRAKVFITSSLVKQFLKYSNKSTMINDLIKDYSQRNTAQVDYYPVPHRDSENHEPQNGNLERHEVLRS